MDRDDELRELYAIAQNMGREREPLPANATRVDALCVAVDALNEQSAATLRWLKMLTDDVNDLGKRITALEENS